MNNLFSKIKFLLLLPKPKVVMVTGHGQATASLAISQVLQRSFRIGKDVLIYEADSLKPKEAEFLLKKAKSAILVATHAGEYQATKEFFAAEKSDVVFIEKLAEILSSRARLVLNFDDATIRDIKNKNQTSAPSLTFGFGARADIQATDVFLTQLPAAGTNFKINYKGNIVPVWLKNLFGKEHIYAALAAVAVGEILGLNLVEVSDALKSYQGFPGRMKLIEGIKSTLILDDSASASPSSMAESLDILKRIAVSGRKIAVLGDIIGVGQSTVEAHEALGAEVKDSADLLFTVGLRAKFYAEGAKKKGFAEDKIFSFNEAAGAGLVLQKEIKEGDLILVDGSRELQMIKIVDEIKKV